MREATLFQTIDEIQEYLPYDIGNNFLLIKPFIIEAKRFIIDILGDEQYNELLNYYLSEATDDELYDILLDKTRVPLINYAYKLAYPRIMVRFGENGITETSNPNMEPVSLDKADLSAKSLMNAAYEGIEELLKYLEKNYQSLPLWKSSRYYSYNTEFFVNNAEEWNRAIKSDIKRRHYIEYREYIYKAEDDKIKAITCIPLFNRLKQLFAEYLNFDTINTSTDSGSGAISMMPAEYKILIEMIRPIVCYWARAMKDNNAEDEREAIRRGEALRDYLNVYYELYPEYAESPCYKTETGRYKNTSESGFLVMGAI